MHAEASLREIVNAHTTFGGNAMKILNLSDINFENLLHLLSRGHRAMLGLFNRSKGHPVTEGYPDVDELYHLDTLDWTVSSAVEFKMFPKEDELDTEEIEQHYRKLKMIVNSM